MAEEKLTFGSKIVFGFGIICIAFGAYKCTSSVFGNDEESVVETTTTTEQTPTVDDNKCFRCDGYGETSTYSSLGCSDVAHFPVGDCTKEGHTSECTPSGHKTCPCCHGTGKRN